MSWKKNTDDGLIQWLANYSLATVFILTLHKFLLFYLFIKIFSEFSYIFSCVPHYILYLVPYTFDNNMSQERTWPLYDPFMTPLPATCWGDFWKKVPAQTFYPGVYWSGGQTDRDCTWINLFREQKTENLWCSGYGSPYGGWGNGPRCNGCSEAPWN